MVELRGERVGRGLSAVLALLIVLGILLPVGGYAPVGPAMPGVRSASAQSYPGWMTPEQAALFTNDWPALVPTYVPEPFASVVPSIYVDGGSYRVYWLVGGGPPTFLEVRAVLNGSLPAGSYYDRNNQLFVNATVRGYEAYHDLTPAYDAVYWLEGSIAYFATSQGLPTDIVSYANSLVSVTAPAPEPTATIAAPAVLYSPDSVPSGGSGMVTSIGGGADATLVADGGYFPDTGTASYPGSGDATVSWVAPDVAVDTTVTFSLLDASGTVLVTTPTLVTAGDAPVQFSLACAPSVAAGDVLPVSVTGSGNVMLDVSAGSWPQTSPNTDYDPGTDGATLAFTLGGGGTATLSWSAPATAQVATIQAYGPSGMVIGSCQVEVVGVTPTIEPTTPVAAATTAPTLAPGGAATIPATVQPTATARNAQPVVTPTSAAPDPDTGDGTDPGSGSQPTVPGTGAGDGIDGGQGTAPSATARPGDGIDPGTDATIPTGATYPAIPTSAPLPDAPPTSVPPTGDSSTVPGRTPPAMTPVTTVTIVPSTLVPSPAPAATSVTTTAPISVPPRPATQVLATATSTVASSTATVIPTSSSPARSTVTATVTATAEIGPPTAVSTTAVPTAQPTTVRPAPTSPVPTASLPVPTATLPAPTATIRPATATATATATETVGAPVSTATVTPTATTLPASPVPTRTPPIPTPTTTGAALVVQGTAPPSVIPTPPTATSAPATSTGVPPTATSVPTTATSMPATPTAIPTQAATATFAPPTATSTRRLPATATATPIRTGQEPPVAGALASSPVATTAPTEAPTEQPASPTVPSPTSTPTLTPVVADVAQQIGPDGGTIRHSAGAELEIDGGVFESMMMVSIAQVADTDLPVSPDVNLVPSSGYDIEIAGLDGRDITTLPAGVVLRLSVPEDVRGDAVVYWIDGADLTQLGVTNQEAAGISAPLAHLSRYVAGVPIDENPELGWLPWAVAAAAAISGLLIVGLLANQSRRQRRRGLKAGRAV